MTPYSYAQGQFIPVFFKKQIRNGTFEYSLNYLIDNELDLSIFAVDFKIQPLRQQALSEAATPCGYEGQRELTA